MSSPMEKNLAEAGRFVVGFGLSFRFVFCIGSGARAAVSGISGSVRLFGGFGEASRSFFGVCSFIVGL